VLWSLRGVRVLQLLMPQSTRPRAAAAPARIVGASAWRLTRYVPGWHATGACCCNPPGNAASAATCDPHSPGAMQWDACTVSANWSPVGRLWLSAPRR